MPDTWLTCCERRDGPPQKQGYGHIPARTLAQIEGICGHSMEGHLAAAYGELDRADRPASWTVSNPKVGKPKQHYPLESVTWANGSADANKRFVSIENEGRAGEPLTGNQVANLVAIMGELATLCPQILPYERSTSAREHNEMTAFGASATACPSGRIPWAGIIAALEEDEMDAETKARLESLEADRKAMSGQIGALEKRAKSLEDDRKISGDQFAAHEKLAHAGGPHSHEGTVKVE